jgi:hypothetical protein
MISIRHNFVKLNDKKKDEIVFFFQVKNNNNDNKWLSCTFFSKN